MTIAKSVLPALDDRRSVRNHVRLEGSLQVGTKTFPVIVLNVSAHGVMAEFDQSLSPGRPVTVELSGLVATRGRVAWVRQGHMGVAFDEPLTLGALLAIV